MSTLHSARFTVVALLLASSLAACGDDRTAGGGPITEDNAASRIAAAGCAAAYRCCTPGSEVDRFLHIEATSEADCRTQFTARLEAQYADLAPIIAAGDVAFDAEAASRCVSDFGSIACGRPLLRDESFDACSAVYSGMKSIGEPCTDTAECEQLVDGELYCDDTAGECALGYRTVGVGQACEGAIVCAEGGYCDAGTCVASRAVGATCASATECATNICDGGTCAAAPTPMNLAIGAPCTDDSACASSSCACADDVCTMRVCAAVVCDGV